jgi:sugar phosphate isomerase/epimerase
VSHHDNAVTRRRLLGSAGAIAGTAATVGALGPLSGAAQAHRGPGGPKGDRDQDYGFGRGGDIPLSRIGVQAFTVRDLMADNELDLPGAFEVLADAGIAQIELGGDYDGRTPQQVRAIAEQFGMRIASNHFGPRTLIQNSWYDPAERQKIFAEARALGLDFVGTGHSYIAPRTVDGYKAMAAAFNEWGADARRNGFKYFFFHNHDVEFTLVDGRPIYDILLKETDPRLVKFELDIGWIEASGQSAYEYIRRYQDRFVAFHVKDIVWDPNGFRAAAAGTANAGKRFSFADVGKGVIDWPKIFGALKNPRDFYYFIEHDDAGDDETPTDTSPRPRNPAGSANTVWRGRKYLANLELKRRGW